MNIKAKLSISRCSDGTITIEIEDATPSIRFFRGTITPENFGNAVTGLSCCEFESAEVLGLESLNKRREVKVERVKFELSGAYLSLEREKAKAEALAPYEVDGWKARASDLGNHHMRTGDGFYKVTFVRFVSPK